MASKEFFIREGRLRPTWRVVCYAFAVMMGTLAFGVLIGVPVAAMVVVGVLDESAQKALESPLGVLGIGVLAGVIVALPVTYLFRRFLDRGSMVSLGFRRKPGWWKQILGGLVLGTLLMGLIFWLEWAAGWLQVQGFAWHAQSQASGVLALPAYVIILGLVAFWEELSFRGYILQNLDVDWGAAVALVASSILFGLSHAVNPNFGWLAFLNIFLAGTLLAVCYLITKELWLPMAFHFSWNFVQGPILAFPVSGMSTGGLILSESTGNPLITGGPFGPEAGLTGTVALVLGLLILWAWYRTRMG